MASPGFNRRTSIQLASSRFWNRSPATVVVVTRCKENSDNATGHERSRFESQANILITLYGILILYVAASVAAVVAYRVDKSAAQSGGWRVAESTLHMLALIGGWPGALIAQKVFHH